MATKIQVWIEGERVAEGYYANKRDGRGWIEGDKYQVKVTGKYLDGEKDVADGFDIVEIMATKKEITDGS